MTTTANPTGPATKRTFSPEKQEKQETVLNNQELQEALEAIQRQGFTLMDRLTKEFPKLVGKDLQPEDIDRMLDALPVDDPKKMAENLKLAFQHCLTPEGKLKQECLDVLLKKEGATGYSYLAGETDRPSSQEVSIFTLLLLLAQLSHERWVLMDKTARFIHFERVMGSYKDMLGSDASEKYSFFTAGVRNTQDGEGQDSQGSMWWKAYDDSFSTVLSALGTAGVTWLAQLGGMPVATAGTFGQLVGQFGGAPHRFASSGQDIEVNRARMEKEMGDFLKQKFGDMKRELDQRRGSLFQEAKDIAQAEAGSKSTIGRNIA